MFNILPLFVSSIAIFNSFAECGGGRLDFGQAVQDIVDQINQDYTVIVSNNCSASIYLKCASADDAIVGDGSDDGDWWTLESGQTLSWGFGQNNWETTCFWCYANSNVQAARDSGNWYIHQNVWGVGSNGCDGAPADHDDDDGEEGVTNWEFRDDGAFSNMCNDCQNGAVFEKYQDWGPEP